MSVHFDPQKRIYDLYSFDVPYDLEPTGLSDFFRDYSESIDSHKNSTLADTEDEERFRILTKYESFSLPQILVARWQSAS